MIRRPDASSPPVWTRGRSGARWALALGAVALLVAALLVVWRSQSGAVESVLDDARVTASSAATGTAPGDAIAPTQAGWRSGNETVGAWLDVSWEKPREVHRLTLVRNTLAEPGVTDGYLSFSDGSYQQVRLSASSSTTVVPVAPRQIDRLRFTATVVGSGASDVVIARLDVGTASGPGDVDLAHRGDGNVAPDGAVTADPAEADPSALVDGLPGSDQDNVGADWTVLQPQPRFSVGIRWDAPRELSSIELLGSARGAARVASARLAFEDGTSVPVGAVLPEPGRPTVVAFMPRVTSSVQLTIDRVDGAGPLALAELRLYQRGGTPIRDPVITDAPTPAVVPPPGACPVGPPFTPVATLTVTCPPDGAASGDRVTLQAIAPAGYTELSGRVWPGNSESQHPEPVTVEVSPTGPTALTLDLFGQPPGPLTVAVETVGEGRAVQTVYLQLYRLGPTVPRPSEAPAVGRTLVYAEEFDRRVSLSRDGLGADYATAKPTDDGAEEFGDAVFPDPADAFDNVGVVDGLLHIGVTPLPAGYTDPLGWGRQHIGGLIASARRGGSGFSAQYGYFEARILAPAAPGTWPAFWMLPADNLVQPTSPVAEIDAVELYGHSPSGSCHSTHEFQDGQDGGQGDCAEDRFPSPEAALAWHTYGVSILPTGITFYIDGRLVAEAPQVGGGAAPMFFMVDLALGGGWPVDLTGVGGRAVLYVDHIRVYV